MNDWQTFFKHHAPQYNDNSFTHNTLAEVDFLLAELALPPSATLLDIGCGTGRHSLELARRGVHPTGIDLSADMLAIARAAAQQESLPITFTQINALHFTAPPTFDAAICLCEGALCLLAADDDPFDHDLHILRNIHAALKPGARFIVNVLNAMRHIRAFTDADVAAGRYDPLTLVEHLEIEVDTPDGPQTIPTRERGYTAPEFRRVLQLAGFHVDAIYGGTAGAWNRQPPSLDEYELMAFCTKPA